MLVRGPGRLATESILDRVWTQHWYSKSVDQLWPNYCHWIFHFAKCILPRQHNLLRLILFRVQWQSRLKVPKGNSATFQAAQVLRVLLQCSGAFCQAGKKEPMFSQKPAWNLVSERLIYHTLETFNKLKVPNLLGPRVYLQFAIFLQAATWSNSFETSVTPFTLQLSLHDPEVF